MRLLKTAPKPAKKAAVTTVITMQKQITGILKKLGYTVDKSISSDHVNYSLEYANRRDNSPDISVSFNLQLLEYCCGVREAGSLYTSLYEDNHRSKADREATELLIALCFIDARDHSAVKDKTSNIPQYKPIIFCSNGEDDCVYFENAFKKYLKGYYKLVSTTQNPGSGNVIKTYISTM